MSVAPPINLQAWIDEHRALLKPPVGNQMVWKDRDFIVMIVGGPNARKDYHVNPTEELFYQVEGDITVKIIDHDGQHRDIPIRQGELFLLPPNIPHSPQRPAGTVGMVVERQRPGGEVDHLRFYCDKCKAVVYEPEFNLKDIVVQLKKIMEEFWAAGNERLRTCKQCGHVLTPPQPAK
ncbi:MAG: 3-hydroxyanthranilate 3,4-dioxygenase [Phycisphaerae bacterium]